MASKKILGKTQAMVGASPMKPPMDGSPDDYEAKNALDDIMRANEHMANPDMMSRVKKHAGRKLKALTGLTSTAVNTPKIKSISDLKKARDSLNAAVPSDDEDMGN